MADFSNSTHPATLLLDSFFPGLSLMTSTVYRFTNVDLTIYLPLILFLGLIILGWTYIQDFFWDQANTWLMSTADIRIDDEVFNMVIAWVSNQKFAQKSRHFVANTNLNSRTWFLRLSKDDEDDEDADEDEDDDDVQGQKYDELSLEAAGKRWTKDDKKVQYTPSFGTHYFWYKGRLLVFKRSQDRMQVGWNTASEREEISISSFGRDPSILKQLLEECKVEFLKNDENRTIIYRGGLKAGTSEPAWTRCASRISRPFSTVVLDEQVKKDLLADMRDYLHPFTRRWYSNRGIPYRRGYLLYGPPGTGKSSLSFAIAGFFKLKIYIVSLNSPAMNEENLGALFTDLPKQCVVLLEDIDTAGLTHTRRSGEKEQPVIAAQESQQPSSPTTDGGMNEAGVPGRISLSGLLNVLDGVASQEGRVLIMTTNHISSLNEALIRPGRVDMMIQFSFATTDMIATIFRGIFTTLEGDIPPAVLKKRRKEHLRLMSVTSEIDNKGMINGSVKKIREEIQALESEKQLEKTAKEEEQRIRDLSRAFAAQVPSYMFTPAEIQGYLLKWKRAPEAAVEGAEKWIQTQLEERKKKKERETTPTESAGIKYEEDGELVDQETTSIESRKLRGKDQVVANKVLTNGLLHTKHEADPA